MKDYGGYYKYAVQYYEQGKYEQALGYIKYAIRYSPCEEKFREFKREIDAKLNINHNYEDEENDYGGYYKYAVQYYEQGKYEQALGYIEYAIRYSPYEEKFLEFKREIELRIKETPVFNEPKKEIESDTKDISIYTSQAETNKENGQYNKAIEDYTKVIELDPENDLNYQNRAQCYYKLNQYEEAIEDYSKAIKLGPEFFWNYKARAECYEALKKFELVKKDNEKALELSLDKGMELFKDGDFEKAIDFLKVAIELNPDDKKIAGALESAQNGKIDIMSCTKKGLMTLDFIDEKKADDIINARNEGNIWYNYQEFAQAFDFQPHQYSDIEEKLTFPLKQGNKYGRRIDV